MRHIFPLFVLATIATPSLAAVTATETVRCALNSAPDNACRMTDTVATPGVHKMVFAAGGKTVTFVGKSQSGWWAGRLNGKPAMGYERNRGNVVLSTYDLATTFSWWYPANAHGTY